MELSTDDVREILMKWLRQSPEHAVVHLQTGLEGGLGKTISGSFTQAVRDLAEAYLDEPYVGR